MTNAEVVIGAFGRIGIRRTALVQEHLADAAKQINLALVKFANLQPNLWTSEQQSLSLVDGTATYALPARVVMPLSVIIRTGSGATQQDRFLYPVSTTDYAAYPNKTQTGFPSVYWFDRQIVPQITFYLVPDGNGPYTALLQCVRQVQDANLPSGETPDLPYRWLDAFEAELAHRLARTYRPELEDKRKLDAKEAWDIAAVQDTENVPMTLAPRLRGYYRA